MDSGEIVPIDGVFGIFAPISSRYVVNVALKIKFERISTAFNHTKTQTLPFILYDHQLFYLYKIVFIYLFSRITVVLFPI